jgi:hypothetical protein
MPAVKALSWCRLWNARGTRRGGDAMTSQVGEEVEVALWVFSVHRRVARELSHRWRRAWEAAAAGCLLKEEEGVAGWACLAKRQNGPTALLGWHS